MCHYIISAEPAADVQRAPGGTEEGSSSFLDLAREEGEAAAESPPQGDRNIIEDQ